jgi:hypothetical protein
MRNKPEEFQNWIELEKSHDNKGEMKEIIKNTVGTNNIKIQD